MDFSIFPINRDSGMMQKYLYVVAFCAYRSFADTKQMLHLSEYQHKILILNVVFDH